jgi:hypothetical protein
LNVSASPGLGHIQRRSGGFPPWMDSKVDLSMDETRVLPIIQSSIVAVTEQVVHVNRRTSVGSLAHVSRSFRAWWVRLGALVIPSSEGEVYWTVHDSMRARSGPRHGFR